MTFKDPIAAYNAASNIEAHLVCDALVAAGIGANAVDDVSPIGVWMFGLVPEIHKPQVWIDRADSERAKVVIDDYERRASIRRSAERESAENNDTVQVTCDECGKPSSFPRSQVGSVQTCPHCWKFMDIEEGSDLAETGDWVDVSDDSDERADLKEHDD